jgi:hypothetical protein
MAFKGSSFNFCELLSMPILDAYGSYLTKLTDVKNIPPISVTEAVFQVETSPLKIVL